MGNNKVKNGNNTTAKKIWDIVSTILVILYTVVVLFIAVSIFSSRITGHPSLFGYSFLYVETDSMEGDNPDSLFVGDLVICKQQDNNYEDLEIGEVIAYREMEQKYDNATGMPVGEPYEVVKIHRIIGFDGDLFITKGDNVEEADPVPVNPYRVLGVYTGTRVAGIGSFFGFVQSPTGIMIFMVLPMAAFFIYALFKFVKAMIEYKMSKELPADGELTEEQKQAAIAEYLAKQAAEANKDENNTDSSSEE